MIPYVQSASSQEVPPPYEFPGVTVNAFVWDAQMAPIQAYCDRYFNLRSEAERGFVYKAAAFWPYALLLFIDYPVMISSGRDNQGLGGEVPYSDRGIVTQKEVFVALPVMRYGTTPGTLLLNSTLEWTLPFIVVQNPMSAICGREMIGLEKLLAEIRFEESTFPESFRGSVNLPGWVSLAPTAMQRMLPFLEVNTGPVLPTFRGSPTPSSPWTLLRSHAASEAIDSLVTVSDFLETASAGLIPTAMRTVALKQFRDAAEPEKALYQALVSCRSRYSSVDNFQFYNEQDVDITFHDQGSFAEILRVFLQLPDEAPGTGDQHTFKPRAAFRFNANINFDDMKTLHTFPVDRGPGLPPTEATDNMIAPWLAPWRGFFGGSKP